MQTYFEREEAARLILHRTSMQDACAMLLPKDAQRQTP
jgi:hypothetical protein